MSIEVARADAMEPSEWNRLVERASYTDAMHQWEALAVLADYADASLHPLVGYKGQEPVGIFPLFERRVGPVRAVFSPPPDLRIVYLGPGLLHMEKLSQRKRERRQRAFVDGVFGWMRETIDPAYINIRTTANYPDVRPFTWNDCRVLPTYTYHVPLAGTEAELLERFSRDARSNIQTAIDADLDVAERDESAIEPILAQVRERYVSQGIGYHVPPAFVTDLYRETAAGTVRPFTCRVDGEFVGGILAFQHGETIARWQGGVKPRDEIDTPVPVNDALDWALMRAGRDLGCRRYDLVGADMPRINRYKAKFGPELVPFYRITRRTVLGSVAASVYSRIK